MTCIDDEKDGPRGARPRLLADAQALRSLTLAAGGAALAMLLFIRLAHEMLEGETRQFDAGILHMLAAHRTAWLFTLMHGVTVISGPLVQSVLVGVVALALALRRRFWPDGLVLLTAGIGGGAVIWWLKHLFHRPRPDVIFDRLGYSFPSGHSFFALVVYGTLAHLLARRMPPQWRGWCWAAAGAAILLVGFSRMYLGEHYPSDVAAGYAVGLPWLGGCLTLPKALARLRSKGRDGAT